MGFYEFSRRAGDFALSMSLVGFELRDGRITDCRIGVGAVEDIPRRLVQVERLLNEQPPSSQLFEAAALAAAAAITPMEDAQISVEYRRALTRAAVRRALDQAIESPSVMSSYTE